MGSGRNYNPNGGFTKYEWTEEEKTIGGVKVLTNPNAKRDDLPYHSNTSDAYFKRDSSGEIIQMRIYKDRKAYLDFDINPKEEHENKKSGEIFKKGIIHAHEWKRKKDGSYTRDGEARYLSNEEIGKWGEIIKLANQKAKFRL